MKTITFEQKAFYNKLIWLFPIIYLFHISEESNGFTVWVTNTLGGEMTIKPFLINNSVFMLINIACCFIAMKTQKTWATFLLFFWVSAQEFWNFVFHVYSEFKFNAYSPGYFTAIFLYFPVFCYLSYLCLRDRHLSWQLWLSAFLSSSSALALTIWGGLYHFGNIPLHKWF
jgi:hypothetical protein